MNLQKVAEALQAFDGERWADRLTSASQPEVFTLLSQMEHAEERVRRIFVEVTGKPPQKSSFLDFDDIDVIRREVAEWRKEK